MADRFSRNPGDKQNDDLNGDTVLKKKRKSTKKYSGSNKKKNQLQDQVADSLPISEIVERLTEKGKLEHSQEGKFLSGKGKVQKANNIEDRSTNLLEQSVRVTRSQWRKSIAEQQKQLEIRQGGTQAAESNCIPSTNPSSRRSSRSSSRASSRASSPVSKTTNNTSVGRGRSSRNSSRAGSPSTEQEKQDNSKLITGKRTESRSSSRTASPEIQGRSGRDSQSKETTTQSSVAPATKPKAEKQRKQTSRKKKGKSKETTLNSGVDNIEETYLNRFTNRSNHCVPTEGASDILLASFSTPLQITVNSEGPKQQPSTEKASRELPAGSSKARWSAKVFDQTNTVKASSKVLKKNRKRARSVSQAKDSREKRGARQEDIVVCAKQNTKNLSVSETVKTGGRISRGRTSQAQTGERRSTTGSCASSRRSSRRSRALQEASAMATDDARNNQQADAIDNEPRAEEPIPGSSSSHDNDSNLVEDLEMSRLQALLEARGLPSHLFGNLGPRMHLLLQRTFSSGAGTKTQQLLTGMQSEDEGQQLTSVMEMCQLLVMGNEDTLGGFPVKQAVPVLINLLQMEHNFDITIHACRALTYLMEALPRSSAVVVDAIPAFLEKLQIIQCMDVAEQSLTALEMLSRRHGKAILQAGGLNSCLLYLDFFSIAAQRCALGIASNCCQSLTIEEFMHVKDAIPILSARLSNQDKKSIENVCAAFARLVDNFQRDKRLLEELCAHGLLNNLQQLLMVSPPTINSGTFTMVIRMLVVLCANCPAIAVKLLKQNIADTIRYLLVGNSTNGNEDIANNELIPRTPQELYEITCLVSELLPNLPSGGVFSVDALLVKGSQQNTNVGCWQWRGDHGVWHNYMWVDNRILETAHQSGEDEISLSTLGRNYIIDFSNMQQINEDTGTIRPIQRKTNQNEIATSVWSEKETQEEDERKTALDEEPELGESFVLSLISVMYDVYYSSVGPAVKHKCLNSVLKMLYHSNEHCLEPILEKIPISSYIAGMLTSNDHRVVCCALQKADILMTKLPDIYNVSFRREGVMHRAQALSTGNNLLSKTPEKANSSITKPKMAPSAPDIGKSDEAINNMMIDFPKSPSDVRLSDVTKRKKSSKRPGRQRQSQAMSDDIPATSSKKSLASTARTRSSTFSSASASPPCSSKTSFFSSFAPRWGRSQSYTHAAACSSKERPVKEPNENKLRIKAWIKDQASSFHKKYFTAQETGDSHPALKILNRLTRAAENLSLEKNTGLAALKEINDVLKEKNEYGACAFEILHSGLINNLLKYLTHDSLKDAVTRNTRIRRFLHVFLGCPDPDLLSTRSIEPSMKPSLPSLVQKLNLCINQLEQFPVKCHDLPSTGTGSRGTSALRFFNTHQIKCNLQKHPEAHNVRQWKGGTVKIDPLALVQAVERYLVIRGFWKLRENGDDDDSDEDEVTDGEIDEAWGSAVGTTKPKHYLELILNGRVLSYDMTIYQAVRQYGESRYGEDRDMDEDQGPLGRASIWSETHTIWYRPVSQNSASAATATKKRSEAAGSSSKTTTKITIKNIEKERNSDASLYLTDTLPSILSTNDPSLETICLMRVLYYLNANWGSMYEIHEPHAIVSVTEFINAKLSAKVSRQLQDPLVIMTGNVPAWLSELAKACPFLFPFECRQQLFYSTTFDRDRALMKLQESVPELASADTADRVTPRLEKKKRTVPRTDLLKQAENVMNDAAGGKAMIEIQYEGEVGTGLGPTLEFYALVSKELQKSDLQIWRGDSIEVEEGTGDVKQTVSYIHSSTGLFPAPLPKNVKAAQLSKVKSRFRFLGKFVAKAIMDSRMIDIPFSQPFCKWMVGHEASLQLQDLQYVDQTVFKSLNQLQDVVKRKKAVEKDLSHTPETLRLALANLTLDGVPIEELGLDFCLPGHHSIELKKNGKDVIVTIDNLEEYVKLVVHWTLVEGVSRQFHAFREGFESVFPISSAQMFYASEIDLLLCGSRSEKWDVKDLIDCCRPDHGYTHDSRAVRFLFDILSQYDSEDQRKFLQFITGSPRLPVGGFRSLNPPLTIVRKTVDQSSSPDNYLPSVMTCVNYLKLPDYSSLEVMSEKLRTAYTEGKNAFHLS